MASALADKLTQCSTRITTANADSNIAACFSAWLSIHQSLHHYFALSARAEQSEEVRASQERFDWHWTELPAFPLRQLFPLAAETLSRFPDGSALAMLIADLCVDACKQNVLAKTAAMESGVIQGLCALAARVAAAVRKWDLPRELFLERAALLIYRVFEALHYISESPTFGFYSKAPEVKREFLGAAQKAWAGVDLRESIPRFNAHFDLDEWAGLEGTNHALFLAFFCFTQMQADESNEHYLSVLRNIAEAWEFQFPTNNQAFLEFMGRVLENLEQQSSLLARQDAMLISELLVILKRTLDPEAVPYNHRLPYFTPAMNTYMSGPGDNSGDRDWDQEARIWNEGREATTRKEVRNEALSIRLQQHSGFVRQRRNIIWVPATSEPVGVASTSPQASSSSNPDRQRTERELSLRERDPEAGPSTKAERQPSETGRTLDGAGHANNAKGDHERAREERADAGDLEKERKEAQEEAPHADGDSQTGRQEAAGEGKADMGNAAGSPRQAEESENKAENRRTETQGPESAGWGKENTRKERGGERVCGWCSRKQKERAPGTPKFKMCARCEGVFYCNAECQKLHWSQHKPACART